MQNDLTFVEEIIRAASRSGWLGLLLLLAFGAVYIQSLWNATRRRHERVLQGAVINVFIVAMFNLYGIYCEHQTLRYIPGACAQSALLWMETYLRLKISLLLACSLVPLVLLAAVVKPRDANIRNPGCFPGALASLLGTVMIDLFTLAAIFGRLHMSEAGNYHLIIDQLRTTNRELRATQRPGADVPASTSPANHTNAAVTLAPTPTPPPAPIPSATR